MDAPIKSVIELMNLQGKTALVTGAAGGIGGAISKRFAEMGARLQLVDIDRAALAKVRESIRADLRHAKIDLYSVDLTSARDIQTFWQKIAGDEPDVLINSAGIYPTEKFLASDESFDHKVMELNLQSVMSMCREMMRARGSRGGTIVNIGSVEAIVPFKSDMVQYAASKAGVLALTRSLARDFGAKGWRVNAVLPGGIRTTASDDGLAKKVFKIQVGLMRDRVSFTDRSPIRRIGEPDDVARVVLFLASDMSQYMNGALVPVDGGFLSS